MGKYAALLVLVFLGLVFGGILILGAMVIDMPQLTFAAMFAGLILAMLFAGKIEDKHLGPVNEVKH